MPEPLSPERLEWIRRCNRTDKANHGALWEDHGEPAERHRDELLVEVDRLKAELAEMESTAADWASRLIEQKGRQGRAESRIAEALDLASRLDPSCGRGRVQAFIADLRRALGEAVSG